MDEKRLDELERIAKEATPGPWHADKVMGGFEVVKRKVRPGKGQGIDDWPTTIASGFTGGALRVTADMEFVAALNPSTVLDLIRLARLARLGLWAEKHGVPALKPFADCYVESQDRLPKGAALEIQSSHGHESGSILLHIPAFKVAKAALELAGLRPLKELP